MKLNKGSIVLGQKPTYVAMKFKGSTGGHHLAGFPARIHGPCVSASLTLASPLHSVRMAHVLKGPLFLAKTSMRLAVLSHSSSLGRRTDGNDR